MTGEFRPGERCGDYELLAFIGQGGMAQVWSARSVSGAELVAIKALLPAYAENAVLKERLLREGASQNMLRHPNILRSRGTYEWSGSILMVMDLVDGESLERYIQRRRIMPVPEVRGVAQAVLSALSHAHDHHIVHRDVKPSNILLSRKGRILLGDFGIALLQNSLRLTRFGGMGTPSYMSPEQVVGRDIDHRSDIYSVGCVLYELLTGAPPFSGTGPAANETVRRAHQNTPPEPLIPKNPDVPAVLEKAVLRALEKSPAKRFESCAEFAAALGVSIRMVQADQPDVPEAGAKGSPHVVFPKGHADAVPLSAARHGMTPSRATPSVEMPRAGTPPGIAGERPVAHPPISGPGVTRFRQTGTPYGKPSVMITASTFIDRHPGVTGVAAIVAGLLLAMVAIARWRGASSPATANPVSVVQAPASAEPVKTDPPPTLPAVNQSPGVRAPNAAEQQRIEEALASGYRALGQPGQTATDRVPAPDAPVAGAVSPTGTRPPPLAPPPGAAIRSTGVLQWVGNRGDEIEIDGSTVNKGALTGDALPGVPVTIVVDGDNGSLIQGPAQADGYRRLILRAAASHLRIHWNTLATGAPR